MANCGNTHCTGASSQARVPLFSKTWRLKKI